MTRSGRILLSLRTASLLLLIEALIVPSSYPQEPQQQKPAPARPAQESEPDEPRQRMEWFYRQRADAQGRIPAGARIRAIEALEQMRREERGRLLPGFERAIVASGSQWTPIGPQPTNTFFGYPDSAGRVTAIAVDPRNPDVVYLGGAQGGVWKSVKGGANWVPITDTQVTLAIGSIAVDPSNPDVIYVGTGEENFAGDSYYGAGILKSTDAGATWSNLPGPFAGPFGTNVGGARIGSIAVHPTSGQILLAAVQIFTSDNSAGIYRSTDGGATWTNVLPGAAGTEVVFSPLNGNIAYAALGRIFGDPQNGVYRSADAGVTWTAITGTGSNVLPVGTSAGRIEIGIAPSNPDVVYASVQDPSTNTFGAMLGFFKTTDGGQNWIRLTGTPDYCSAQCWYDNIVRVHPQNPDIVFIGGAARSVGTLLRSLTGGVTWENVSDGAADGVLLHVDQHALAFSNPASGTLKLYNGNDGGAWSTTDITAVVSNIGWTNLNSSLNITQFYPGLSIHPSDENIGIGGTQDNGTQKYTGDLAWSFITCGDGGWTAIDTAVPSTMYGTCQNISIRKSTANGNLGTWNTSQSGIGLSDRVAFIPPLVIDEHNPQTLYFGTFRVYQTTDGASNWAAISPDLTGGSAIVSTIAVAPSDSNTVYAGTSDGRVQMTLNAGAGVSASWTNVTTSDLPGRFVTQIAIDPLSSRTVYVAFSGFSGTGSNFADTKGHIFRSTNAGATWVDVSANLPNTPVNDIVIDPDLANTLYVGTDVGVFFTSDGGSSWSTLVTGLPRIAVLGLKLRRVSRTLRAATHGRGMWDLRLTNFLPPFVASSISPSSAAAGAAAFTLNVQGAGFVSTSIVRWNGANRPTTFISDTQLQAAIPASDLAAGGVAQVTVFNSSAGALSSNSLVFTVLNPSPSINLITPSTALAGSGDFTLSVQGTNLLPSTVVRFGGRIVPTTFVSSITLTAAISASDITEAGRIPVVVVSPTPGGGVSGTINFTATTTTPPANDNFANAISIPGSPFTDHVNNFAATTEVTDPSPSCAPGSRFHSIWYKFTSTQNVLVNVNTFGSAYDSVLTVVTGSPGAFVEAACNDDAGGTLQSQLSFNAIAGLTYFIMISGFGTNDGGPTLLNLSVITVTPPMGFIDLAVNGLDGSTSFAQGGVIRVAGWAADNEDGSPVSRVEVRLDGAAMGNATLGLPRPDVATAFSRTDFSRSGWTLTAGIGLVAVGAHTITAVAFDSAGGSTTLGGTRTINVAANTPPVGFLDFAGDAGNGSTTVRQGGTLLVAGWAADNEDGAPVARVEVLVDGTTVGLATLGQARPDVATVLNRANFTNSGWSFTVGITGGPACLAIGCPIQLAAGPHSVTAVAIDTAGASTTLLGQRTISVVSSNEPPFGFVDVAVDMADGDTSVRQGGTVFVGGWAADNQDGAPVARVEVRVDGLVAGNATLALDRPDVSAAFSKPSFLKSGWSFTLTAGSLSLGTHIVTAVAFDSAGVSATLTNSKTITVVP